MSAVQAGLVLILLFVDLAEPDGAAVSAVQAGLVLTLLFVPNIMSLDLREGDRRFDALIANTPDAYNGDAVAPANLSFFERWCVRQSKPPQDSPCARAPDSYHKGELPNSLFEECCALLLTLCFCRSAVALGSCARSHVRMIRNAANGPYQATLCCMLICGAPQRRTSSGAQVAEVRPLPRCQRGRAGAQGGRRQGRRHRRPCLNWQRQRLPICLIAGALPWQASAGRRRLARDPRNPIPKICMQGGTCGCCRCGVKPPSLREGFDVSGEVYRAFCA